MYFSLAGSIIASAGSSSTPVTIWYYKEGSAYMDAQDRYWNDIAHWWSNSDGTGTHPSAVPWVDATYLNCNLAYVSSPTSPVIIDTVLSHAGTGVFTFTTVSFTAGGEIASGTYVGTTVTNEQLVSGGNFNAVTTFNNLGGTVTNTNSPDLGSASFVPGGYCAGGFGGFPFDGPGCMASSRCNYDAAATWDDGSCSGYKMCDDIAYCNYSGSIVLPDCLDNSVCAGTPGCTNPAYCNYDPSADCDDGSCAGTPGCMDMSYCNYNPSADCAGACSGIKGCTNGTYCNYNPLAECDDGSCFGVIGLDC